MAPAPPVVPNGAPAARAAPADLAATGRRQEPQPRRRGPFLRFSDTLWDWGVVWSGREVRHLFVLHNDGDRAVRIRKARPT